MQVLGIQVNPGAQLQAEGPELPVALPTKLQSIKHWVALAFQKYPATQAHPPAGFGPTVLGRSEQSSVEMQILPFQASGLTQ